MTNPNTIDAARVELLLGELRRPGVRSIWAKFAGHSNKEGWPAARFLAALAEHEMADRSRNRLVKDDSRPIGGSGISSTTCFAQSKYSWRRCDSVIHF
jgi:hypothetical protein